MRSVEMLGLPKGEVFLNPWTEEWIEEFLTEKDKIKEIVDDDRMEIYHIGSTAIRGLSAKPILDIAIEINKFTEGEKISKKLEKLGYVYAGTNILPDRHYLIKGEPRTHQIHMYQRGSKYLEEQLKFRDYLRENTEVRKEYEQLKMNLAVSNKNNKHNYAEEKTAFIKLILERF